jgi:hypothetical protein
MAGRRFEPTLEDPDWFSFFYKYAVQQDAEAAAAFCDAPEIAHRLEIYRGTQAHPDVKFDLFQAGVDNAVGAGAGAASCEAWDRRAAT